MTQTWGQTDPARRVAVEWPPCASARLDLTASPALRCAQPLAGHSTATRAAWRSRAGSHIQFQRHRSVVGWPLPAPRFAVDRRRRGRGFERITDQDQVDAQAHVAAERRLSIVPPAVVPGIGLEQAEAVMQTKVGERLEGGALRRRAQDVLAPGHWIVDVAIVRADIE